MTRKTRIGVQLATAVEEPLLARLGETCFAQRKYRGKRAIVEWIGSQPVLKSSYGNVINCMGHIENQLRQLCNSEHLRLEFDGELYVHGWTQQKINGATGRGEFNHHPERTQVQFIVYDIKSEATQVVRIQDLHRIFICSEHCHIKLAETLHINTKDYLFYCGQFLEQGYEGIILRNCHALYQPAPYRTRDMLKYKPSQSDNYTIVGFKEGTGRLKHSFGAFLVIAGPGEEPFYVGTGPALTDKKRAWLWQHRHEIQGNTLVVKHEPMTTERGIPICTSAVKLEML